LAGGGRETVKEKRAKALELLDKYAETQNKQRSYICKWKVRTKMNAKLKEPPYSALSGKSKKMWLYEFGYDGSRYIERQHYWGNISSARKFIPKERGPYNSQLWDGDMYFDYVASVDTPGRLSIYKQINYLPKNMKTIHSGTTRWGPGIGLIRGFWYDLERIDFTLGKSRKLSIRDKKEKIRGVDCYVIDAEFQKNKYTLWIDPEHGYNIAQAQGKLIQSQGKKYNVAIALQQVHFRKIDDVWIIEEGVVKRLQKFKNNDFTNETRHCKLTEMMLNPDHDALGAFVPDDIKNGAKVMIKVGLNRVRGTSGRRLTMKGEGGQILDQHGNVVSCTWQDGKVIDDANGLVVMDFGRKENALRILRAKENDAAKTEVKRKTLVCPAATSPNTASQPIKNEPNLPKTIVSVKRKAGSVSIVKCDDGVHSYAVCLPSDYEKREKCPVIFCFDPGGDGKLAVRKFAFSAEKYGCIIVGSLDAKNGPWKTILKTQSTMLDDIAKRYKTDEKKYYAAGFSGGARMSYTIAYNNPSKFKGVIACGGGFGLGTISKDVAVYHCAGNADSAGMSEVKKKHLELQRNGVKSELKVFSGGHNWPPDIVIKQALDWLMKETNVNSGNQSSSITKANFVSDTSGRKKLCETRIPRVQGTRWTEYPGHRDSKFFWAA